MLLIPMLLGGSAARQANGWQAANTPVTASDLRLQTANNSPLLAADPTDERFIALASRIDHPIFGCALHVSGDSGESWVPADPVPKLPAGAEKCYAPEVAFGPDGVLYYLFLGLHTAGNTPMGVFITTSSDQGRTFSKPSKILGPLNYMVRMGIDPESGERGRIHIIWLRATSDPPLGGLGSPPNPILGAHSDNGGRSFSKPVMVSQEQRMRVAAPALALGAKGEIHVIYYDLADDARDYHGLEGPTWEGKWRLVMANSKDGGRTFDSVPVDDNVIPPERVLLIFTMPPPAIAADKSGHVYAAWHDARNGDWDVLLKTSSDKGHSFGKARRLNDDPMGSGTHQYMPRLSVAPNGRVDATFYDRRNDPGNNRNDVYYVRAASRPGPNHRITEKNFDSRVGQPYRLPSNTGLREFGARIALLSADQTTIAAWTDTRNSIGGLAQDIFSAQNKMNNASSSGSSWMIVAVGVLVVVGFAGVLRFRRTKGPSETQA